MRTNKIFLVILLACFLSPAAAQIRLKGYNAGKLNNELLSKPWSAKWISIPGEPANGYGVCHFRKSFALDTLPVEFIVHVSADNRYKLFVNGKQVALGPARGNIYNWNFETVDIAPYLKSEENVIAAVVWNYADRKPLADISFGQTGFLIQGNGSVEQVINSNSSWGCTRNEAYSVWDSPVYGYYVAGPGERVESAKYLWGWEQKDYDDSDWKSAREDMSATMKGGLDYSGYLLVPTPIPPMEHSRQRFAEVRIAEGVAIPKGFPSENGRIVIPANSKTRLVLDQKTLTTGYPSLLWNGGKDAVITLGYTEAYYLRQGSMDKGNRNEIDGKLFAGYEDRILCDGGDNRSFTPLWWRTWRYLELRIETASESLIIEDIISTYSAYPFVKETVFDAPERPELSDILDIGWRTARLCANETYMDCPYYEQLQYFGDTRIQAMVSLYNTRDPYLVKNALEQGRQSMVADGLTMSRYPTNSHQFIPSFSLFWICMGHDYWMMRGDEEYMKTLLPAYRSVLAWFEPWMKPDNSLAYIPYWFFLDWADGLDFGSAPREANGNSAIQDLLFLMGLDAATEMERAFGIAAIADYYESVANRIRTGFDEKYWDEPRGLYADTHDHRSFSQHTNSLAVIAGVISGDKSRSLMEKALQTGNIIETTIYFRYYLNMALNRVGLGDQLLENLNIWEDQMALGLTTWAECPEPARSDCHAWGSSPNVEFYRTVLGIESAAPGFTRVRIAPSLGALHKVSGSMPHPSGSVAVSYKIDKKGRLSAEIDLPGNITGVFAWKNREYPLHGGKQNLEIKPY